MSARDDDPEGPVDAAEAAAAAAFARALDEGRAEGGELAELVGVAQLVEALGPGREAVPPLAVAPGGGARAVASGWTRRVLAMALPAAAAVGLAVMGGPGGDQAALEQEWRRLASQLAEPRAEMQALVQERVPRALARSRGERGHEFMERRRRRRPSPGGRARAARETRRKTWLR